VAASFQDCTNQGTGYGIIADVDGAIWSASPGYDLATGLGSMDVNNLVTKWSTVQLHPTTTTLVSVNPSSPSHGQPVTFNITVTSSSGTPTGDVALMVNPGSHAYGADAFTLVNGTITANTTQLPGGTYTIVAHYAGDGTFAPSDSSPFSITVTPQASLTTIQIADFSHGPLNCFDSGPSNDAGSESYGAVYFLRVVIGNPGDQESQQNGCYPLITNTSAPTGTVTLTDNGGPLGAGTYALNGRGYLEIPTQPAGLGPHVITAAYSGDTSYGASSAGPYDALITKANTSITISASATVVAAGSNVTLTATVFNSNHGTGVLPPSGSVTFTDSLGNTLGTGTLGPNPNPGSSISSIAQLTIAPTAAVTAGAQYGGDANYLPSVSSGTVTITIGNPDFTVTSNPSNLNLTAGQSGTSMITVTPSLGFTGTVALSCPAPASLPAGMTCGISPATLTPAADGKPVTAVLTLGSQPPSVILANAKPLHREWMALVASGGLAFAGIFLLGDPRRRRLALAPMAMLCVYACASCSNLNTPGTSHNSQLLLTTSRVKSPAGDPVTFSAAVAADHSVSGTVDFLDSGVPLAQGVTVNVGRATFTTNALLLGTHSITASYSGDGSTHSATTSTPLSQVITGSSQLQITATSGTLTHTVQLQFSLN
jgi:hypothetical protein